MQLPIGYYRKLKQIYINIRNYIKKSFNYIVKIYPYVSSIECMINNTTYKPIQDCEHACSQFVWLGIISSPFLATSPLNMPNIWELPTLAYHSTFVSAKIKEI